MWYPLLPRPVEEGAVKLGILGGTFDPVHLGHLLIAEEARVRLSLEKVLFVPAGRPWMKVGRPVSPGFHRLEMVRLAVADNPYFEASALEVERPGPTYTVDTLLQLRDLYGEGADLYFILGVDSLQDFHRWKAPDRVLELCTLVTVARPGYREVNLSHLDAILPGASQRIIVLHGPLIGISGTEIRRRVAWGLSIRYWVPRPVEEYIYRHGLYRRSPVYEHSG